MKKRGKLVNNEENKTVTKTHEIIEETSPDLLYKRRHRTSLNSFLVELENFLQSRRITSSLDLKY